MFRQRKESQPTARLLNPEQCVRSQLSLQYSMMLFDANTLRFGQMTTLLTGIVDSTHPQESLEDQLEEIDRSAAQVRNLKAMQEPIVNRAAEIAATEALQGPCGVCTIVSKLRTEPCPLAKLALKVAFEELGDAQLPPG